MRFLSLLFALAGIPMLCIFLPAGVGLLVLALILAILAPKKIQGKRGVERMDDLF